MVNFHYLLGISAVLVGCLACVKSGKPTPARSDSGSSRGVVQDESKNTAGSDPNLQVEQSSAAITQISAFSLDDLRFSVLGVAVGLQDFMTSQAPILTYELPRDADYVEVLRCKSDVVITSGTDTLAIADLALSTMSESERTALYRSNDLFRTASEHKGCELASDAQSGKSFLDFLAPSGSYRYLIRACVNPARITDLDKVSSRNCSLRVAVSPALDNFVNTRRSEQQANYRQAQSYASKMENIGLRLRQLAGEANAALDYCEKVEHTNKVDKRIRDAWLIVVAAVVDTALTIYTLPNNQYTLDKKTGKAMEKNTTGGPGMGVREYYMSFFKQQGFSAKKDVLVEILQFIGSTQGYILSSTLLSLGSSSNDVARSCARYKELFDLSQVALADFASAGVSYQYYILLAQVTAAAPAPTGTGRVP